jgi:polar amino acid transport system substrate-binding protein
LRKPLVIIGVLGLLLSACGKNTTSPGSGGSPSGNACAKGNLNLITPDQLTMATDNPAFQPWFGGKKSPPGSPWKAQPNSGTGDPNTDVGYESEVAYDVAEQLGFAKGEVKWVAVPFNNSYKPGPKDFDFYIGQVSFSPERAQAVGFSVGYFDVQQALVANKGTPISKAKTFADLKPFKLGVQIGTTSFSYIKDNIKPAKQPAVYNSSNDVIQALNNGQIDGYLVDAPDAYVNVLIGEAKHGVVVGQFPTIGQQERYGLVFEKGNSLVGCVDHAIESLKSNGTLDKLHAKYLKGITFPEIKQ